MKPARSPQPAADVPPDSRWADLGMVALLVLAVLTVYWPSLRGEVLWDDPAHMTRAELRTAEGLARIWTEAGATQQYYPVLHTAFWLEHKLWGDFTPPYHLVNVLLHAANACLLAFLLRRLWRTATTAGTQTVPAGAEWLAAWIFAVHPVAVESVAWISEQKNTLSLAFYLLAAWQYLDFAEQRRGRSYALATALFVLALGTKTMTATLPPALLVVLWWRHGRLEWKRDILPLLPWFAVAVTAGLTTAWFEKKFIGAEGAEFALPLWQRGLLAARVFWFYAGKIAWPADLTFFYERWEPARDAAGWWPYLLAGVAATAAWWRLPRPSRGPLAGWLLFAGSLFPALGFFNVFPFRFSYVADHFQYLASISLISLLAAGLALAWQRWATALPGWAGRMAGIGLLALLGCLAWKQSGHYVSNEALFRANLAENPASWYGHHVLAHTIELRSPESRREAIGHYREALRLKADNWDSRYKLGLLLVEEPATRREGEQLFREALRLRPDFPEALNALANELVQTPGQQAEAIRLYRRAVEVKPAFGLGHLNLARALAADPTRKEEARAHFDTALQLLPDDATAHFHFANFLAAQPERVAEALPHYTTALATDPDSADFHGGYGAALALLPGKTEEALAQFNQAIRLRPGSGDLRARRAFVLAQTSRPAEAIRDYEDALRLEPGLSWVHHPLALLLATDPSRRTEALIQAEAAVRANPTQTDALNLYGVLLAQSGRLAEARAAWDEALRLDPSFGPAQQNLRRSRQ